MKVTYFLVISLAATISSGALAFGPSNNEEPPPSEEVFKTQVEHDNDDDKIKIIFDVEKGFYVYKDRIDVFINGEEMPLSLPTGFLKNDPVFNKEMEVYPFDFSIELEKTIEKDDTITIEHQGCAEKQEFCYTPRIDEFNI